jgi:Flp pilus assembly protein TadD
MFHYCVDRRSIPEKALNLVGLTSNEVGKSFALIAGVTRYPNFKPPYNPNLEPAAVDLKNLEQYLKTEEFFDEIVVLKDDDMNYSNLQYFLQVYFPQRLHNSPHSRFLFAYSGHGITDGSSSYLLLNSANDLHDTSNALDLNVVRALVQHVVKSGYQVLVLLNACYGGAFLKNPFTPERPVPRNPGAHAITAGGSGERTWQDPAVGDGSLFFETVFKGLNGAADLVGDGVITYDELSAYLKKEIQVFTDQHQNPQSGSLIVDDEHVGSFFFLNRGKMVQYHVVPPWNLNRAISFGDSSKDSSRAAFDQGRTLFAAGDFNGAIARFTEALKARDDWADAFNLRAASYDKLGQLDSAFADYDQAVKLAPDWSSPIFYRGQIFEKRSDLNAALADYRRACELSPGWHDACAAKAFTQGKVLFEARDFNVAIASFTEALKARDDWADAFNLRAASYDKLGQLDSAFADYDKAVKLAPNWSSPIYYRGLISEKRGDLNAALADYRRACELSPKWQDACAARDRLSQSR